MQSTEQKNKPTAVFKAGGVRAAVWTRTVEKDGKSIPTYSIQVDRTYKQGETWKHVNSFNVSDLPKVALVVGKAFEFLTLRNDEKQPTE